MADGFIVRKGGVTTEQALAPTITEVSTDVGEIVFTLTNNDTESAVILFETNDEVPDENSIQLAGGATSDNITITGLTVSPAILFASANVVGKVKSNITERSFTFTIPVFTAATGGTTLEYDSGGKRFKSHTFTSDGTFTVTTVGDNIDDRNKVDFLIIAGGAGGGAIQGGGGGAGGYQTTISPAPSNDVKSKVVVTEQAHSIFVGAGGNGTNDGIGSNGVNSSGLGITSTGGGAGNGFNGTGANGGSGGGGGAGNSVQSGGDGILGQGTNGGNGSFGINSVRAGGGGGGAGQLGQNASGNPPGDGGNGLSNTLRDGTSETRAGGGAGGARDFIDANSLAQGGAGGGGDSGTNNGTTNTGSGGGGGFGGTGDDGTSGAGGSGIVVIRYEIAPTV